MENFEEQISQEQPEVQPEAQQEVKQIPEQPQQPVYQQPVYQQPVYQQPIYQQPVYQQSVHQPEYQPATPELPKKSGKAWKPIIAGLLILALVVGSCGITAAGINAYWQKQNMALSRSFEEKLAALRQEVEDKSYVGNGNSVSGTPNTTPDGSLTPAQVYAKHVASVVAIECTVGSFFQQGVAFGSGFILTADGYIATNYHVVENAKSIRVVCSNGNSYTAAYVGGDEDNDIAVIKAEASDLQPVTIGSSDHLIVGDQVVAIGNPLGTLASTLTVGYVSAKDRLITTEGSSINMIQTDAAINPGNSGGPLFNMKGEVIGITSAKYSGLTSSGATIEGIGFAIPMDDVIGMLRDLMEKGYISGAYLAVNVRDVTQRMVQIYGLPLGALVYSVEPGLNAQQAGIQVDDVIVSLGGYKVESVSDMNRALRKYQPGDTVTVTVFRYGTGAEVTVSLTLDETPAPSQGGFQPDNSPGTSDNWFDHFFGN